jgi:hypothetical protein
MLRIEELLRLPSPAPKPQSLAYDGTSLWMGSLETRHLYAIDPQRWTVREDVAAPGTPYGMTVVGDELRVLCGETDEDHRVIRRFVPGHGFRTKDMIACPDDTGSQLGYDGDFLYVSQWYNQKLVEIDETGKVMRRIDVPHGICGQVIVEGRFYLVTTDDEATDQYWLTCVDARAEPAQSRDLAHIPFAARGLAWDGTRFWTNHRENNEIVAFADPR